MRACDRLCIARPFCPKRSCYPSQDLSGYSISFTPFNYRFSINGKLITFPLDPMIMKPQWFNWVVFAVHYFPNRIWSIIDRIQIGSRITLDHTKIFSKRCAKWRMLPASFTLFHLLFFCVNDSKNIHTDETKLLCYSTAYSVPIHHLNNWTLIGIYFNKKTLSKVVSFHWRNFVINCVAFCPVWGEFKDVWKQQFFYGSVLR